MKGFCCLYFLAYKAAGGEEGKARMEGGGHDKEVASSKKVHSRLQCKNRYPIYDQNGGKIAKIDTQFMTKTAEKPYPFGAAHIYIAHIRVYPPPPPGGFTTVLLTSEMLFKVCSAGKNNAAAGLWKMLMRFLIWKVCALFWWLMRGRHIERLR